MKSSTISKAQRKKVEGKRKKYCDEGGEIRADLADIPGESGIIIEA